MIIVGAGLAVLLFALWEIRNPSARGAAENVFSFLLVNLNIILLLLLVFLVVRNLMKLVIERRQRIMGSQLRSRMVMAFVTIALFPATVMLLVSVEFFTNTIDNWFSTEVERSLSGAYSLARTYYATSAEQALLQSNALGEAIQEAGLLERVEEESRERELQLLVRSQQRTYNLGTVQVFDAEGRQLAVLFNERIPTGLPLRPDQELLAEARAGRDATSVEPLGESDIVRGATPVYARDGKSVVGTVVVDYFVESSPRRWSEDILSSFREFRRIKISRKPFKNLYILTMVLASLVVVFSATWLGLYLARGITEPIGRVAEATHEVASGNWDVEIAEPGGDELGILVRGFNSMTAQLKASHEDLDERRRYIENVLSHIDAGVVTVDRAGLVSTVNPAAVSLLGLGENEMVGREASLLFDDAGYGEVAAMLEELEKGELASGSRRDLKRENEGRTLLVTVTELLRRSGRKGGAVLFFEDVSQIAAAERMEAWREVARRIAHEIKNPLTPIQLSAQRLSRRLRDALPDADREVFDECTTTIVAQVEQLKDMVNEFSRFARHSDSEKLPHDLNQLIGETMPLYRQSRPDLDISFKPSEELPTVMINRESVKRALINLLDNAVSVAGVDGDEQGRIVVETRYDAALARIVLEVSDNGPGIPLEHRARVFDPFFSTKEDGTGLGLAIVASVSADHQAYLRLCENRPRGSTFIIEFPVSKE
ncbi:MAG: ATP-binding protein [Candidatus Binatia bacterium]